MVKMQLRLASPNTALGLAVSVVVAFMLYACGLEVQAAAASGVDADPPKLPRQVLVLNSHSVGIPWATLLNQAIIETFRQDIVSGKVQLHLEYTGLSQNLDTIYQERLIELYQHKYRDRPLALIMAADVSAIEFIEAHRHRLFPGVPVVFTADGQYTPQHGNGNDIIGTTSHIDIERNIETILRLHPNTRQFAVIGGADPTGRNFAAMAHQALAPYHERYTLIDLVGLPMVELFDRIAHLPEHTVVLSMPIFVDGDGQRFIPRDILPRLSQVANAPLYSFWDTMLGFGIVGGYVSDTRALGRQMASIAQEILAGTPPQAIQVNPGPLALHFDCEQLQRWNLSPRQLPQGSILHNQPVTPWQLYRLEIAAALAIMGLLLVAVIILLFIRRHLRIQIAQRTQMLIQTNAELEKANIQLSRLVAFERERHQEKIRFLDMLAHELRTPISTIRILLHGKPTVPEGVSTALNDINMIIERCLQAGQLEDQALSLVLEDCTLDRVLAKVLKNLTSEAARVNCTLSARTPVVQTDGYLLEIILHNLLDNALKYSPEASPVEVTITPEQRQQQPGVQVRISNQVGIAGPPDPTRVFQKYYRNPKAYRRSGSGLGLSLTQGIARMLGMALSYEPPSGQEQGVEVVFVLWMPLMLNPATEPTARLG